MASADSVLVDIVAAVVTVVTDVAVAVPVTVVAVVAVAVAVVVVVVVVVIVVVDVAVAVVVVVVVVTVVAVAVVVVVVVAVVVEVETVVLVVVDVVAVVVVQGKPPYAHHCSGASAPSHVQSNRPHPAPPPHSSPPHCCAVAGDFVTAIVSSNVHPPLHRTSQRRNSLGPGRIPGASWEPSIGLCRRMTVPSPSVASLHFPLAPTSALLAVVLGLTLAMNHPPGTAPSPLQSES